MICYLFNRFVNESDELSEGFILKLPSTTHGFGKKSNVHRTNVMEAIMSISVKFGGQLSYVMLQRKLKYNIEYKVVVFKGSGKFIMDRLGKSPPSDVAVQFSCDHVDKTKRLLLFAEMAVRKLESLIPECISDGLVRVDVFSETVKGFVVNEFESLEANWLPVRDSRLSKEVAECQMGLETYWRDKFLHM